MASRSPEMTIADLLDEAAKGSSSFKVDHYLDTLEPDIRERVVAHLKSPLPSRRIAITVSNDKTTDFTLSASSVDTWRAAHGITAHLKKKPSSRTSIEADS